jgi:3-methyladenine DNA glycosylase AlkC
MAEALKHHLGPELPQRIAAQLQAVHSGFDAAAFLTDALAGYEALELMPRARQIAHTLRRHLPAGYIEALALLMRTVGAPLQRTDDFGMSGFFYLPHVFFVAHYGLDHFEPSMQAQKELTKRFTAEFSIRPYLERHPGATLATLHEWARDPDPHVRRLVSEGTRPRLPWAPRLREFQRDPAPVLALLEQLKDDPELYVRRSVANNLNDIGKDHPELLLATAQRWLQGETGRPVSAERRWLVQHALRSAVKRGEAGALAALGYGAAAQVAVTEVSIAPAQAVIGGKLVIALDLTSTIAQAQTICVDIKIHYVKASGATSPKVFKLRNVELAPWATDRLGKTISLAEMSTRKHYPGRHRVELVLNGQVRALGEFELRRV